jgi:hypothetical protein
LCGKNPLRQFTPTYKLGVKIVEMNYTLKVQVVIKFSPLSKEQFQEAASSRSSCSEMIGTPS